MKTIITKYTNYQNDQQLINDIESLILPSYERAGEHSLKDISVCDILYTIEQHGQLIAFFMVGYHQIDDMPCCYLGLSACHENFKNSGYVKRLYLEFSRDCIRRELDTNNIIVCYWTTATPIVYHWFCKHFSRVEPNREGETTKAGRQILEQIAKTKYSTAFFDKQHPFLLEHAAHGINYSESERLRILEAVDKLELTAFKKFKLNELNGDRFLMFGYTPSQTDLIDSTQPTGADEHSSNSYKGAYIIENATSDDLGGLLFLNRKWQKSALNGNLANGFIGASFAIETFLHLITEKQIVVAKAGKKLVGYYLLNNYSQEGVIGSHTSLVNHLKKQGKISVEANVCVGAQAVVDFESMGLGLREQMLNLLMRNTRNRYDYLFATIAKDNLRAFKAHTRDGWNVVDENDEFYLVVLHLKQF